MESSASMSDIDNCHDIDLIEISEPTANALRLVVAELSRTDVKAEDVLPPLYAVPGALLVERGGKDRLFEVFWESYAAYGVRNESYTGDEPAEFEGKLFRLYSRSLYLDYVRSASKYVSSLVPNHRHWGIVCVNHIVDVVSNVEPRIRRI